jgi:hypothetical protein
VAIRALGWAFIPPLPGFDVLGGGAPNETGGGAPNPG